MKMSKSTPDRFFTLTVESEKWESTDPIPVESIEALIAELEELRGQLLSFVIEAGKDQLTAN